MAEVKWTRQASQDFESIVGFIAKSSAQYASLFVIDVFEGIDRISLFPESGRIVPETNNPTVREIILGNYRLVYRLRKGCVELLTLHHGARLLDPSKLKES